MQFLMQLAMNDAAAMRCKFRRGLGTRKLVFPAMIMSNFGLSAISRSKRWTTIVVYSSIVRSHKSCKIHQFYTLQLLSQRDAIFNAADNAMMQQQCVTASFEGLPNAFNFRGKSQQAS